MNLKTITAGTMSDALSLVKREFGADALILHTRTYKRGAVFGLGGRRVVEVTAIDRESYEKRTKRDRSRRGGRRSAGTPAGDSASSRARSPLLEKTYGPAGRRPEGSRADGAEGGADAPSFADMVRQGWRPDGGTDSASRERDAAEAGQAMINPPARPRSAQGGTATLAGTPAASLAATAAPAPDGRVEQLAQEMKLVRRMVEQMMQRGPQRAITDADASPALTDQYLQLLQQELADELAGEVVKTVQARLTSEAIGDPQQVREAVCEALSDMVPADEAMGRLASTQDGRPRTIALVGPTGVGKTTTVAKLAASFKLRQDKNVGLITIDTYRIAAVDQLRTYANIIGVPLHVATSSEELSAAMRKLQGCDVVLIDTAGRSPRDDQRLTELARLVKTASPHEVHLVLSSAGSQAGLLEAAERFAVVSPNRVIFTKLDEAVSFGVLFNVARQVNQRLSYLTTGQEVPHQIEPGRSQRLASLVMGESL